jgi:hypothetical protein
VKGGWRSVVTRKVIVLECDGGQIIDRPPSRKMAMSAQVLIISR